MLYLDTEFNGHGGQLISLALVPRDVNGPEFYGVLPLPPANEIHPWVSLHVIPKLDIEPEPYDIFRFRLFTYLSRRNDAILADWPADLMHLLACMLGDNFDTSWSQDRRLILLAHTNPKPDNPHNALSDARALRDWHVASKKG